MQKKLQENEVKNINREEDEQVKKYFYGFELSQKEIVRNRISFYTLSRCFNHVLCNNIVEIDQTIFDNIENGDLFRYEDGNGNDISYSEYEKLEEAGEECYEIEEEIYQYYIISDNALYLLKEAEQIIFYSEKLDCYIWGVTHWGTGWSMVFTSIKIDDEKE